MKYREMTLAFVVVAVMATVLVVSGSEPAETGRRVDVAASGTTMGSVTRGYLGLVPSSIDEGAARGARVREVVADGPADRAGVRPGDVITSIAGRPVRDGIDLHLRVTENCPGAAVELGIDRDGVGLVVTVEIGERPARISRSVLSSNKLPA